MNPQLPRMNAVAMLPAVLKHLRASNSVQSVAPYETAYRLDRLDARDIRRYNAALGFAREDLPVTYYYLIAQRAHLATLLDKQFPFRVVGLVHVENELIEHATPEINEPLDIVTTLTVPAPGDSGALYCLLETIGKHGSDRIFTCRSTYLIKRGQRKAPSARRTDESQYPVAGEWTLASSTGREYAAVSGDWNPIHLWNWSARLMGMKSPIIHGMHTLAKACSVIEARAGKRITAVSARFKGPIPLGSAVRLTAPPDHSAFEAFHDGRVAAQGTLSFMSTPLQEKGSI